MKHHRIHLFLPLLFAMSALSAEGQTPVEGAPKLIDYQGTVLDLNGNPLAPTTPTNYTMKFRLYTAQSGGAPLWSESQTVTVNKGAFSVRLGQGIPIGAEPRPEISTIFAGKDRFLGLTVVIPPQAEAEITPRLAFLTSPFSFVAERSKIADSVLQSSGTSTLGTTSIANFTLTGPGKIIGGNTLEFGGGVAGKSMDAGKIGYGTFTANTLDIVGAGSATNGLDRKVKIFAEGGLSVSGPLSLSGDQTISAPSSLLFSGARRQMINFHSSFYGLGVQDDTLYSRSYSNFAWFRGGAHNDNVYNPGVGGSMLAHLNSVGLNVNGSVTSSDRMVSGRGLTVNGDSLTVNGGGIDLNGGSLNVVGGNRKINLNSYGSSNVAMYVQVGPSDDYIMYATSATGNALYGFQTNGVAFKPGGGSWTAVSDIKLKKNVENLEGALPKLLALRSVRFDYKDEKYGKGRQTGFIAQEMEEIFPEWVTEGPEKFKSISFSGFESVAVQALRELRAEKDEQLAARDAEIVALKKELDALSEHGQNLDLRLADIERLLVPQASHESSDQAIPVRFTTPSGSKELPKTPLHGEE